jgi:polyhydroxybutyrate depolymerase
LRLPGGPGPHPAIIYLHGHGGSGAGALRNDARLGGFLDAGWAVIAPDGARFRDGGPRSWNAMASPAGRDDVAFLHAVADDAAARFGLARGRMAASGFSAGGMMVWRLACDAPGAFAAYAPVSGTLWQPLPQSCAGPAPLLHTHGLADKVVPLEGRSVAGGRLVQGNLFTALSMLRRTMGCAAGAPAPAPSGLQAEAWTGCEGRGAVTLVTHGGGHTAPSGWAELALAFFAAHPPR